ncbi:MAG: MBG domain-containing protein [Clostridiales bacterium]|nr:MBG domain-containing protein [Clostridiales bacterium]
MKQVWNKKAKRLVSLFLAAVLVLGLTDVGTLTVSAASTDKGSLDLGSFFRESRESGSFANATGNDSKPYKGIVISYTTDNGGTITLPDVTGYTYETSLSTANKSEVINLTTGKTAKEIAETYLSKVKFNGGALGQRVSIMLFEENVKYRTFYWEENKHYYQYVPYGSSDDRTWTQAYDWAKEKTFMGRQGYLATVTSKEEDLFIYHTANVVGWLGGTRMETYCSAKGDLKASTAKSDKFNITDESRQNLSAAKEWYWACGPEAGTVFYNTAKYDESNGANDKYNNWNLSNEDNTKEPNNTVTYGGHSEECLTTLTIGQGAGTGSSLAYSWNDISYQNQTEPQYRDTYGAVGYFVEYGDKTEGNSDIDPTTVSDVEVQADIPAPRDIISKVDVTDITAPQGGVAFDTEASVSQAQVSVVEVKYYDGDAVVTTPNADYNKPYNVKVKVKVNDPTSYEFAGTVTGTVNGQSATVTKNEDGTLTLAYQFPATEGKTVTHTGNNKTVRYDGNTIDITSLFTLDGNAGVASYSIIQKTGEGTIGTGNKLTVTSVGEFVIKVSTEALGDYKKGEATAKLTVEKGNGTGVVEAPDSRFGTAYNVEYSSRTNGTENVSLVYYDASGNELRGKPTAVGSYKVTATFPETDLYNAYVASDNFEIYPADDTGLRITNAPSKDYDGQPVGNPTYTGEPQGATPIAEYKKKGDPDSSYTEQPPKDAGEYQVRVRILDEQAGGTSQTSEPVDFTIRPKQVTATITVPNKSYDGTKNAEVTAWVPTGIEGEELNITGVTGTFENPNAGTNKPVTIDKTNAEVTGKSGTNPANYEVMYPDNVTATIEKAQVTVKAKDVTLTKGDAVPTTYEYTVEGKPENGAELQGISCSCSATQNSEAGEYDIIVTANKNVNPNYQITVQNGKLKITNGAAIVITGDLSKDYDGQPVGTPTYTGEPQGTTPIAEYKKKGDPDSSYTEQAPKDAGEYEVRVRIPAGQEGEADKTSAPVEFTIRPKQVTVKAKDVTLKKGDTIPTTYEYTVEGKPESGEELQGISCSCSATQNSEAGEYDIIVTANENANPNYQITVQKGTLKITKGTDIVIPDDLSKDYDGDAVEKPVYQDIPDNATLTIEYKKKEEPDSSYTTEAPKDAGEYIAYIKVSDDNGNILDSAKVPFTIYPAKITIKPDNATKHIGSADPKFTYSVTNGTKAKDDDLKGITFSREMGETAGTYKITATVDQSANPNYNITVEAGILTIEDHKKLQGEPVIENQVAPTETTDGSHDEVYYCVVDGCKGEISRTKVTDPAYKKQQEKNELAMNAGLKVSQTGSNINVQWGEVAGADGYRVYVQYCGKKFTSKSLNQVKSGKVTKITIKKVNGKKLDLKKNYKVYVVAYKVVNGKKVTLGKTIMAHIVGRKNFKQTNVKNITLKKKSYTLKVGKTAKVKAKTVLVDKKKKPLNNKHARELRFATDNKKVATVSKKGVIKAVGKGSCIIYVYARNGYTKEVKVTVE